MNLKNEMSEIITEKYRIQWVSKITGNKGFSEGIFSKVQAERIAKSLNSPKRLCDHYAVLIESPKEKNELEKRNG